MYDRIVDDFKEGRLKEYYLERPEVIKRPKEMLEEAKILLNSNLRASLVLAYAAGEVGLNKGILAPILHGCFHNESAATLLINSIEKITNVKLSNALLAILSNSTGIDLKTFCRSESEVPLWKEIGELKDRKSVV